MAIAVEVLKMNITTLGSLVLTISDQIIFFVTLVAKKLFHAKVKPSIPDFQACLGSIITKPCMPELKSGYLPITSQSGSATHAFDKGCLNQEYTIQGAVIFRFITKDC
ncbi:hypothetical protein YC2023_045887 [Brassica napus]